MNAVLIKEPQIPEVGFQVKNYQYRFAIGGYYTSPTFTISQIGFVPLVLQITSLESSGGVSMHGTFALGQPYFTYTYHIPEIAGSATEGLTEITIENISSGISFSIRPNDSAHTLMMAIFLGITLTQ